MQSDKGSYILGSFDGMTSAISVIIPLLLQHHIGTLFPVIVSLALGDGFTMAFGEYLADDSSDLGRAGKMGVATALAIVTPSIPFFLFTDGWAGILAIALAAGWSYKIGRWRNRPDAVHEVMLATGLVAVFGVIAVWIGS